MLRVVVLGAAAGGGVPQWNCGCTVCRKARNEHPELRSTQASIAISADGDHWFLINASPDLRQQLIATPKLHPKAGALRHSPIAGVILTNGEVDAVAGLLSMREGSPFTIYAHPRVLAILGVQQHLQRAEREKRAAPADRGGQGVRTGPARRLAVRHRDSAVRRIGQRRVVPGRQGSPRGRRWRRRHAWASNRRQSERQTYVFSGSLRRRNRRSPGSARGRLRDLLRRHGMARRRIDRSGPRQQDRARHGTYCDVRRFRRDRSLASLDIGRKIFLHINNSNPALLRDSAERKTAEHAGWQIPTDGMEIVL